MTNNNILKSGQLLVEILIVIGLMALIIPTLLVGFISTRDGRAQSGQRFMAVTLQNEAREAIRTVREAGWTNIQTNGTYHPVVSGPTWTLAAGAESISGFSRSLVIADVYRDSNNVIVPSGGTIDPSTKKITTTVSWTQPKSGSVSTVSYLTRFLESDTYTETTQTHFNNGTKSGVVVQATNPPQVADDGQVILGSGGNSDWCSPNITSNSLDLPGQGYANAITAIEGKAFAGTGENASGLSFMQVNISNAQPPVPTFYGNFDGHKTNGVFGETNYGYISTDTNSKEVVIIDISTLPFAEVGYFNAPGNLSAVGLFVNGNVGYVTTGSKLYSFDLSSKVGARTILDPDGVTLQGVGRSIKIVGNYAYVIIEQSSPQLQIVDISNPSNMSVVGQATVAGENGKDVFINSNATRAYFVTQMSSSKNEFFIVDISTKTGNRPTIGSGYNAEGMDPKGVVVVPGNRAIIVGYNAEEYQVLNIANESSITRCGGAQVNAGINGISSILESDGDAYSYIVTADSSTEFKIIEGGPGGSYASSGSFESQTFTPGYQTANNRLTSTFLEPANTDIQFQVSLANLVSGSCPATGQYTYVGPDGTSATNFNQVSGSPVTFPFSSYLNYVNPGQCFRYKVYFSTTNSSNTPVLEDVSINYSP